MVLADRNSDSIRNGRRSRGPSPNGHANASESSSEDEGRRKHSNLTILCSRLKVINLLLIGQRYLVKITF